MLRTIFGILLLVGSLSLQAEIIGKEVSYRSDDVSLKGYLAYDDSVSGKRPGILVVHEWWGHNAYVRKRADMLAAQGYTALAVDMYGNGKTAGHPDDAGKFAGALRANLPLMKQRFLAARHFLNSQSTVDPGRTPQSAIASGVVWCLRWRARALTWMASSVSMAVWVAVEYPRQVP